MTTWWGRLSLRRRLGLAAMLLIAVGWFVVPGILCSIALVTVLGTTTFLDARDDRRYLRKARAFDRVEGQPR